MPRRTIETLLIFSLFAVYAGQLPPDVNESHYLTKAKHGWDPLWCPDDIFLASSFSHWLFYLLFGWLNQFFSLPVVAWIGRIGTWLLLAFGWQRLSGRLLKTPGLSIVSAALFLVLNDRFHLAGEWVVGGFEAKGLAYFFVLMALGSLGSKQFCLVWPYLGFACAFHVLVGGWATIAVLLALVSQCCWRISEPTAQGVLKVDKTPFVQSLKQHSAFILLGLCFAAVGALPPLIADLYADPVSKLLASKIYVQDRISHHLVFSAFSASRVAGFVFLLIVFAAVGRTRKNFEEHDQAGWQWLFRFAIGSLCISFCGLMLSGVSEQGTWLADRSLGLLRFYWFRMADFAVPCTTALALVAAIQLLWQRDWVGRGVAIVGGVVIASTMTWVGIQRHSDLRPRADRAALPTYADNQRRTIGTYQNWRRVCEWIKAHTPVDATFITPDQQQTFKWYAQRAEAVNWKDVPQDALAMVDWSERVNWLIDPQRRPGLGLMEYSTLDLKILAANYDATHLLVPQWQVDLMVDGCELKQVYPVDPETKATYVVFEFPTAEAKVERAH